MSNLHVCVDIIKYKNGGKALEDICAGQQNPITEQDYALGSLHDAGAAAEADGDTRGPQCLTECTFRQTWRARARLCPPRTLGINQ